MIITTKINMDLVRAEKTPTARLVCDDKLSRAIQLNLFADGEAIALPADCTALVRYRKPDGTGGSYDTLPDGSVAWSISGSTVTVMLAPQVCNVAGHVKLSVTLLENARELHCFSVYLDVQSHMEEVAESDNYVYLTGYLPQPDGAAVGKYLKIVEVDAGGRVTAVGAADVDVPEVESIPEYVRVEANRLAGVVQSRQNANSVTLLACSDFHYASGHTYAAQLKESVVHAGQAMGMIAQQLHLDGAAMLGDLVWDGGETAQEAQEAMRFVNETIAEAFGNAANYRTRGNHECVYNGESALGDAPIFANVGAYNEGAIIGDRMGGWCYRDYADRKIRVVCINTAESNSGTMVVSSAQNAWLQEALTVDAGWATVLLSHHPLDWNGSASNVMTTVRQAGNVLCNIHGHTHCYAVDTLAGTEIPRIAVPNVCFYRNNEYGQNGTTENSEGMEFGEEITYEKTAGTAQDTAFCVITIDRTAGKIFADHYGAGYDRVVMIGEAKNYTVTYQLNHVTSSNMAPQIAEGSAYCTTLEPESGYAIAGLAVLMGDKDVTQMCSAGTLQIPSVTGDIVIIANAVQQSRYENLVPAALDYDLDGIFNGVGYQNGAYVSTASPYYSSTTDGSVATGLIPYDIYGDTEGNGFTPATIYIKGITFDTSNSHNRIGFFITEGQDSSGTVKTKFMYATKNVSELASWFTIETLGEKYYKLTPLASSVYPEWNAMATTWWESATPISHIAISGNGDGADLIVTFDEPIE